MRSFSMCSGTDISASCFTVECFAALLFGRQAFEEGACIFDIRQLALAQDGSRNEYIYGAGLEEGLEGRRGRRSTRIVHLAVNTSKSGPRIDQVQAATAEGRLHQTSCPTARMIDVKDAASFTHKRCTLQNGHEYHYIDQKGSSPDSPVCLMIHGFPDLW